jgi:hypothetical protein
MQVRGSLIIAVYALILITTLALADADPLGVNQNVTFDEVGGLDDRQCLLPCSCPFLLKFLFRHSFVEGDDSPSPPVSRSLPTI